MSHQTRTKYVPRTALLTVLLIAITAALASLAAAQPALSLIHI